MSISISVIVPVFNSGKSAILSINSILYQSICCDEIIVVDDGSTDNSAELIGYEFSNNERVKIFRIVNGGAAAARNFGINYSSSSYIAFLDSDDVWFSEKIEKQIRELELDPTIGLVGSLTNMSNFSFRNSTEMIPRSVISLRSLLFKNYFQTSTVVVRRSVLNELGGFPVGRRYAEEGDLFMRIAAKYKCILLNEVLVDYAGGKRGFGTAGLSANLWGMERGELDNIRRSLGRGDIGMNLAIFAVAFSLLKYIRRLVLLLSWRLFPGN